jgi:hypothetical protein
MSNQSVTSVAPATTCYESQAVGLPPVNPFQVLIGVISERIMALMALMAESAGSMEQSTDAELTAQKMSNETNEALVNLQNQVNSDNNPNATATLPQDVVDYINNNQIVIDGVTDGGDGGTFSPISTSTQLNCGQLEAVKGEFDVESTSYADSSSQTQMIIQEVAQSFSMSVQEISQLMSKNNQIATTIVNNLK